MAWASFFSPFDWHSQRQNSISKRLAFRRHYSSSWDNLMQFPKLSSICSLTLLSVWCDGAFQMQYCRGHGEKCLGKEVLLEMDSFLWCYTVLRIKELIPMTVQLQTAPEVSEAIEVKNRQNSHTLRIILISLFNITCREMWILQLSVKR